MALAGGFVIHKAMAVMFPISAFVVAIRAQCRQHVSNTLGLLLKPDVTTSMPHIDALTWFGFVHNMIPVIASNLVGGSVLVGLVYYVIYRRKSAQAQDEK